MGKNKEMLYGIGAKILWKDRKRIYGMPLSFTRYSLVESPGKWIKLFTNEGLLSTSFKETNAYRILDVKLRRSAFDKLYGVGTITVFTNDAKGGSWRIRRVKNPFYVRNLIVEHVESERKKYGITITEITR